jgi:CO/xanthine dehydrogenase FAD-binding subunit
VVPRRGNAGRQLVVKSVRGERIVPVTDFLEGIMSTSLAEDEFLAEARLPLLPDDTKFGFYEFSRRAGDFAMSAALVTYRLERWRDRRCACRHRRCRGSRATHPSRPKMS